MLTAQVVHRVEPQSEQMSGDSWLENELQVRSGNCVKKGIFFFGGGGNPGSHRTKTTCFKFSILLKSN